MAQVEELESQAAGAPVTQERALAGGDSALAGISAQHLFRGRGPAGIDRWIRRSCSDCNGPRATGP